MYKVLLVLSLLVSCTTSRVNMDKESITVSNSTSIVNLTVDNDLESYSLMATITGRVKKQTSLVISNREGKIYSYFIGPGSVDIQIDTDWYDTECYIEVLGVKDNSGEINVLYKIR